MKVAWIDRRDRGWEDHLVGGEVGRPTIIAQGLGEALRALKEHSEGA